MAQDSYINEKQGLFDYWDELPLVKELDSEQYKVIQNQKGKISIRHEINQLLASGIPDEYPETNTIKQRHALSAAEIKDNLEDKLDEPLTSSNIYFHLQKLEEADIVQIVGSLPSGRRFTAYYGRTARVYMLKEDITFRIIRQLNEKEKPDNIDNLITIIANLNPDLKAKELQDFKGKLLELNRHRIDHERLYTDAYTQWMMDHESLLRDTDTNLIDFYFMFQQLINYQQPIIKIMTELKELIGIGEYLDT